MHVVHMCTCRQSTHSQKIKNKVKKRKMFASRQKQKKKQTNKQTKKKKNPNVISDII